jgi:hypothetical protein
MSVGESSTPVYTPTTTYSNPLTIVWSSAGMPVGTGSPSGPSTVPFTSVASANKVGVLLVAFGGVVAMAL